MAKYNLFASITCTAMTVVHAENAEEAIKIAEDRHAHIGGAGSGYEATEYWLVDDADGEPEEITAELVEGEADDT